MSKLYLIRHAQASFLAENYDNLSEHGHLQSHVLGDYLVSKPILFDKVYVGPLKRQRQTYERVREAYEKRSVPFPDAIEVEELREYKGMNTMHVVKEELTKHHASFKQWFEEMDQHPSHKTKMKMTLAYLQMWSTDTLGFQLPAGTQSFADFRKTAELGLDIVLNGNEKGKTIAAFSSGGCIAAMLAKIMGVEDPSKAIGFNLVMLNTAISEVLFSGSRLSLQSFNTLPHLTEDMITTM